MNKVLGWAAVTLAILAAAGFGGRMYAARVMNERALTDRKSVV